MGSAMISEVDGRSMGQRRCFCGVEAAIKTSWKPANYGRRFRSCATFWVLPNSQYRARCGYFEWLDGPLCQRGREVASRVQERFARVEKDLDVARQFEKKLNENLNVLEQERAKQHELERRLLTVMEELHKLQRRDKLWLVALLSSWGTVVALIFFLLGMKVSKNNVFYLA